SVEELGGYLSPEQVDAVALAINSLQKGRGFLEADQTGLGKGRVMAALARYSVLQQKTVVFLTETPTLFTDFWRDISDIGSAELFTPMIVNDGVSIFDPISGNKLVPATPKAVIQAALDGGVVDPAYNLVLGTYSQFNRDRAKSSKARWISQIAEGKALLL
ncbi:strawberry notch-like NTP hydrolase domain-containing protein, partial [Citrobacter cronae]